MTLYHSTFRWFGALACTTTPMGQPYNWFPSSQLQHAERYSCRCSASRHTARRGGLRAFSIKQSYWSGKLYSEKFCCRISGKLIFCAAPKSNSFAHLPHSHSQQERRQHALNHCLIQNQNQSEVRHLLRVYVLLR